MSCSADPAAQYLHPSKITSAHVDVIAANTGVPTHAALAWYQHWYNTCYMLPNNAALLGQLHIDFAISRVRGELHESKR